VLPVKESKKGLKCDVTEGLPKPPFLMTVVAPRRSGKTNLTVDLLLDKDKFRRKFDLIFIWSKTFKLDSKWKNIKLPPGSVFHEFIEEDVKTLLDELEMVNQNTAVNTLFVFDDMVTEGIMNPRKMGQLDAIAVRGRHINVSIIIITQQYLALSPPVRNNTTNMLIFRVRNGDEMEKIARENREGLDMREFTEMFFEATKEPYSFLHINNQEQDASKRFFQNWAKPISIDRQAEEALKGNKRKKIE
jgi:hypothetical protein